MAGRFFIAKQFNKKQSFEKNEINRLIKKILTNDVELPIGMYYNYNTQGKKCSISTYHARCNFSGRAKANINKFKMSRMIFKRYSEFGMLNGIRKSSW